MLQLFSLFLGAGSQASETQFAKTEIGLHGRLLAFEDFREKKEGEHLRYAWALSDTLLHCELRESDSASCRRAVGELPDVSRVQGVIPLNPPEGTKPGTGGLLVVSTQESGDLFEMALYTLERKDLKFSLLWTHDGLLSQPSLLTTSVDGGLLRPTILATKLSDESVARFHLWHLHPDSLFIDKTHHVSDEVAIPKQGSALSFVDLNGDCQADLAYLLENGNVQILLNNEDGTQFGNSAGFVSAKRTELQMDLRSAKHVAFGDLRETGLHDIIFSNANKIWIAKASLVGEMPTGYNICDGFELLWDVPLEQNFGVGPTGVYSPSGRIPIRLGDFDLDGQVDLLYLSTNRVPILATWVNDRQGLKFNDLSKESGIGQVPNLDLLTFHDYLTAGRLQILASQDTGAGGYKTWLFANQASYNEAFFFKPSAIWGPKRYDVPVAGAALALSYHDLEMNVKVGRQTQLSQTSHSALQIPSANFGLGRVVSYLEYLAVGLPNGGNKIFLNLIPNSIIFAVPERQPRSDTWMLELYVDIDSAIWTASLGIVTVVGVLLLTSYCLHQREQKRAQDEGTDRGQKLNFLTM